MNDESCPSGEQINRMWKNISTRRLTIPDFEKAKGLVWVAYPLCKDDHYGLFAVEAIVELAIHQGKN